MTQQRHRRAALGKSRQLQMEEANRSRRQESELYDEPDREPRAGKHTFAWLLLAAFSLAGCLGIAYLLIPQITGTAIQGLPRIAFAGQQLLRRDEAGITALAEGRQALAQVSGVFGPGIWIDDVDVSEMTPEQARSAIESVQPAGGGDFSITVQIAGRTWTIDSTQVPMVRNTDEVLSAAWALANESVRPQSSETLFEARLRQLEDRRANPVYFQTELAFDRSSIRPLTDAIAAEMTVAPVNANLVDFNTETMEFALSPDRNGCAVDADALYQRVIDQLDGGNLYAAVTMEPEEIFASVTVRELSAMLGRISTYTTKTTNNKNRNTNVRLSAEAINGYRVEPGAVFSFNQATGQRSERKGYKPATAIAGGQNIEEIGGGVCQTSSTLFNAVARGNFTVVTRSPHAWPSSYVEKGMDATVNWPGLDFQWRNETDYPVWIMAEYANRTVTVSLYGVTLGEGVSIDLQSVVVRTLPKPDGIKEVYNPELPPGTRQTTVKARTGYVVETWQIWYHDGYETDRKLLCTSTYKAYQETVEFN